MFQDCGKNAKVLAFRPHHFLCALCFQGRGYSPTFIANFTAIMEKLNQPGGDTTPIQVAPHTDSICAPCPHRTDETCASQSKINALDTAHAKALGIKAEDVLTWGEAKARIANQISLDTFHSICRRCSWKKLGLCESVLTDFINKV